jgi:NadR type nicotinamide-nucleotide adenylyltransferase
MIITYQKILKGKKIGIVFGTFAPMHQGHLDVVMRAKKECDGGCIVIVDGRDNDRGAQAGMPLKKRYRYIREFFADDDLVAVYPIDEDEFGIPEYPNGWEGFLSVTLDIFDKGTDECAEPVFYVSEPAYWSKLTEEGFEVVCLDRTENPISATMIRENPLKYWNYITYPFRRVFSKNILICGTASEGKTTLVKDLGKYFNAPYSHEYARDYMAESYVSEWELNGADYLAFLDGQYQMNKKLIDSPANNGVFFADSDSMTTRMYAEYYHKDPELDLTEEEFKEIAVAADAITKKCRWDKIYVIAPRGIFVDDHTRYMEFSGMKERKELFEILCRNLKESGNWDKVVILDGGYYDNFKKIRNDIKEMYENGSLA